MRLARATLDPLVAAVCVCVAACVCVSVAACSGAASPTAPSVSSNTTPPSLPPRPTPTQMLTGRVTETEPTSIVEVPHATVRVMDGPDANKSAEANALGFYTIDGVQPGRFTVTVSADGFVTVNRTVDFGAETTANFQLARVFKLLTFTLTGDLGGTDGTCSNGVEEKPCRIIAFPVHNAGPIEATLEWSPQDQADLDLALFQTSTGSLIVRSARPGTRQEQVRAEVQGSAVYELHITYTSGPSVTYTLSLSYPN